MKTLIFSVMAIVSFLYFVASGRRRADATKFRNETIAITEKIRVFMG